MKKMILFFTIAISLMFTIFIAYADGAYPGFTSTIVTDINSSNPIIEFDYPGEGSNSHIMNMYALAPSQGEMFPHENADTFYPHPPTPDLYLIQLTINMDANSTLTPLCELKYNALTRVHQWIVNREYQPNKAYPPIRCKFYLYAHHMFIAVTDK